jgi:hypothetical protein
MSKSGPIRTIIDHILSKIREFLGVGGRRRMVIHVDNARLYVSHVVRQSGNQTIHGYSRIQICIIYTIPYSSDLAPCDCFLFGHVKMVLQRSVLKSSDELLMGMMNILLLSSPKYCWLHFTRG